MLKSLVLDYYYFYISISAITLNFDQVCNFIRKYFEKAEYKQSVLCKQIKQTFKPVISNNEGKQIEEYFEKPINKL